MYDQKLFVPLIQIELPSSVVLLLLPGEEPGVWLDFWDLEWEVVSLFKRTEPIDALDALADEADLVDDTSLRDPEVSSGRNSEEEEDGASVPMEDPTG